MSITPRHQQTDQLRPIHSGEMESGTIVLLDVPAEDLRDCLRITALELRERGQLSDEQMTEVVRLLANLGGGVQTQD